jgi:hypothetical protein
VARLIEVFRLLEPGEMAEAGEALVCAVKHVRGLVELPG